MSATDVKTFVRPPFRKITLARRDEDETLATSPMLSPLMPTDPHLNLPATNAWEFQNFECEVNQDINKKRILINELRETEAETLAKYVRKCLRKFITDDAARQFSWRGNKQNYPVHSYTVLKILKNEAINKFPNAFDSADPELEVEAILIKWFQYAKDRYNKKFKKF